jgi:anti-sigma B factor antagonist
MIIENELAKTGLTVFEPGARLTIENAHELSKAIQSLSTEFPPKILVNMQQTRMVDGSGLGALVSVMKHIRQMSGSFAMSNLSPEIQRLFHLMNLHQVFEVFDTAEAAAYQLSERRNPALTDSRVF